MCLRTVGEKMRYLQFLQKQDVASPVAATPNVFDVGDNYGSPNNFQHKMTVRIRTRNGVRRFQLKMVTFYLFHLISISV